MPEDDIFDGAEFHLEQEVKRLARNMHTLNNSLTALSLAVTELKVKMYFMMKFITGAGMAVVTILIGILIWFFTTGVERGKQVDYNRTQLEIMKKLGE